MEGNEVRKILVDNHVNLKRLAEQLNITPQALFSRFRAKEFRKSYMLEITQVLQKDLFGTSPAAATEANNLQPILDIRVCAGNGIGLEDDESAVVEYVSIPTFNGCKGITVYGQSMEPKYVPGDVIFVRPVIDKDDIDYGRPYLVITRSDRLLKCIYESKMGNDFLRLSSLNMAVNKLGDRLYPDRDIRAENILFLYKVVGSLNRDQI